MCRNLPALSDTVAPGRFLVSLTLAIASASASAEDNGTGAITRAPERLEVIVVTATRREENSQQVPIAVTALTNDVLHREQVTDLSRLQYIAPALVIWPVVANSLSATISMRGMVSLTCSRPTIPLSGPTSTASTSRA